MNGRGSRGHSQAGSRPHSVSNLDDPRAPPGGNLHNFYANQRHQPSRNSNDPEQIMQTKRRLAAQRERELRNLHTEQQYQRSKSTTASSGSPYMLPAVIYLDSQTNKNLNFRCLGRCPSH